MEKISEGEVWKDIPEYEGLYQVSNLGRVKSLDRIVGPINHAQKIKGKILIPRIGTNGYFAYSLCINGVANKINTHRLVSESFIPNPENKPCVNHIDGNKLNNYIFNLEWVTHKENTQHAYRTGLVKTNGMTGRFGELHPNSKPINQYSLDGVFINEYDSTAEASRQTNITSCNICSVCIGKRTSAGNYKWKYKTNQP